MRPTCTRARSSLRASFIRSSISRWCFGLSMSMKSITSRPPASRMRAWRAISTAASQLVLNAVSSMSLPLVAFDEFTSIAVSASVWSMTIEPPEGSRTWRSNALSIWVSIW